MSETIHVTTTNLAHIISDVTMQIPKGSQTCNLRIRVKNNKLYFHTQGVMLYRAYLGDVTYPDMDVCVLYYDISPLVRNVQEMDIKPDSTGMTFVLGTVSIYFQNAFSTLEDIEYPHVEEFDRLEPYSYSQLKRFAKTFSIFKLYKHEYTTVITENTVVMKTPSVWFRGKCDVNVEAVLTVDVYNILLKLMPEAICLKNDMLFIKGQYYMASLPFGNTVEKTDFAGLVKGYVGSVTIRMYELKDIVKVISTLPAQTLTIALSEKGIALAVSAGYTNMHFSSSEFSVAQFTCELTRDIFVMLMQVYDQSSEITIHYRSGVLAIGDGSLRTFVTTL